VGRSRLSGSGCVTHCHLLLFIFIYLFIYLFIILVSLFSFFWHLFASILFFYLIVILILILFVSAVSCSLLDTPPGTSDEHLTLVEYVQGNFTQANFASVLVTTPQVCMNEWMKFEGSEKWICVSLLFFLLTISWCRLSTSKRKLRSVRVWASALMDCLKTWVAMSVLLVPYARSFFFIYFCFV
jgi:hypothetical protein